MNGQSLLKYSGVSLHRESAALAGKTIGLYGGSFNPAHDGHIHVAEAALRTLKLDKVLFLVSPGNPLKPSKGMASYDERSKSVKTLTAHKRLLTPSSIEQKMNSRFTANTVQVLTKKMPKTRFVWIMGADNLATFDKWYAWQTIAHTLAIAIFDRPRYSTSRLNSRFACMYRKHEVKPHQLLTPKKQIFTPRWCFVTIPRHPASSSVIRNQLSETLAAKA